MKNVNELKQDRASKMKEQQSLVEVTRSANREFNAEEITKFDALQAEIESFDEQIKRAETMQENEKRMAGLAGMPVGETPKAKKEERFSFVKAINNVVNKRGLRDVEQAVFEAANNEINRTGLNYQGASFAIPSAMFRAQTVTEDAGAKGGALVGTDISYVEPLLPKLKLEELGVTVMSNCVGNFSLPTGAAFTFAYVGETDAVAATDVAFSGPTATPHRLSGVAEISKQLLLQANAEQIIRGLMQNAIDVAIFKAALNGANGDDPNGLYNLITTNINTTAGAATWDTVVNLETLIQSSNATEKSLGYLSDTAQMGKLKTIKKDAGSGLFLYENGLLNGYKYMASSIVPTLAAGAAHPLVFGDWSQMFVGFWGGASFTIDPYTAAASGKIRIIVDIYNDVVVTNEKAFAINKVMTV